MNHNGIDAVFIDFYGTITAGDRAAVESICRGIVDEYSLPISASDLAIRWGEAFFRTIDRCNHSAYQTLIECERISLVETLASLDLVDFAPTPFLDALENYWLQPPLHDDVARFFETIKLPICCVSNADKFHLESAIRHHGLKFHAVVTSQCARCYKPEPAVFHHALERMNTKPDRVIHIGDSLHSDVAGAKSAGIEAIWLNRVGRIHDVGTSNPKWAAHSLAEAANLLSTIESCV